MKACAQACKQFLPVSRLHLLHTITFLPDNSRHATIESFLGGFPAAVACARVLYVKKYYDNTRDKPQARVISILRLLPFVRTLRFEMDVLSDELLILAPTLLASITTLEFIHAQFPSFGHLSRLLLAMPQLTVLRLDGAWWPTGSVDPDYCNHRLHLVELDLRPSAPNDFIDWYVRGLPSYGTIDGPSYPSTLCLREPVLGNTDRFSTTLIDHAAHLRVWSTPCTLPYATQLHKANTMPWRPVVSYLRLRKLKNLVTLTLDYTQMSSSASMLAIAVDMPCLSSIIVCCWLFAFLPTLSHKGTCVDWAALAKVLLSEASSPQLKMFKITVTGVSI